MSTTWNDNYTPAQDDMWNLVPDMRKQAILNNRVIPVYSKAERDGLATSAPDGVIPDGTIVVRLDHANKGAVFDVFSSGSWKDGETGIVTSGIAISTTGDFTIQSYSFARSGATVSARIDFTYTGATVTPTAENGNFADMGMFQIPGEWSPIWATYDLAIYRPGRYSYFGRMDSGGTATMTHGIAGHPLEKGDQLRMDGSWRIA